MFESIKNFLRAHAEGNKADALRLAVQTAVAATVQFALMESFGMEDKFVGILSAVLVMEPSIGSTLVAARHRFAATIVGCVVGVACYFTLPVSYGVAVPLAAAMFVMSGIAGFFPHWRYGVVAAVALALGSDMGAANDTLQIVWDRSLAIGMGVAVGVAVSLLVWPDKSSSRSRRHVKAALDALSRWVSGSVNAAISDSEEVNDSARREYSNAISSARRVSSDVRLADDDSLRELIDNVERLYHASVILMRVADKTDAVHADDSERLEFIETIREQICDIVNSLTKDDIATENELNALRDELTRYKDSSQSLSDSDESKVLSYSMYFGLNEIEDSLTRLVEYYRTS